MKSGIFPKLLQDDPIALIQPVRDCQKISDSKIDLKNLLMFIQPRSILQIDADAGGDVHQGKDKGIDIV